MKPEKSLPPPLVQEHYTTLEVAHMLGLAVRSVQLMVDRNELEAWKTPGGHRRISRTSVEHWIRTRSNPDTSAPTVGEPSRIGQKTTTLATSNAPVVRVERRGVPRIPQILLIEDSIHFQNLVALLVQQHFSGVTLHTANDGITGLAMYGEIQPHVLIVDILLPGIDGATLITTLRSHSQFARSQLIVVTSLDSVQRESYDFALQGVTVIHKPRLVAELPAALAISLGQQKAAS